MIFMFIGGLGVNVLVVVDNLLGWFIMDMLWFIIVFVFGYFWCFSYLLESGIVILRLLLEMSIFCDKWGLGNC